MYNYKNITDMLNLRITSLGLVIFSICFACTPDARQVEVESVPGENRIDVSVDGDDFEKPFLFPVVAANGTVVTRGYPIDSREGETVDHQYRHPVRAVLKREYELGSGFRFLLTHGGLLSFN